MVDQQSEWTMNLREAKSMRGRRVRLRWTDVNRSPHLAEADVFSVGFLPILGPCLITSAGDIRLDRILEAEELSDSKAA
jgi:hypothetical protein